MQTDSFGAVTLAHLTDPHLFSAPDATLLGINTYNNLQGVVQHIQQQARTADLLLATGDLSQDGSPEAYRHFLELVEPLQLPVHVLPGNHDVRESFHAVMQRRAAPVIELEHWRIVLLDSTIPNDSAGRLDNNQLAILDEVLQTDDPRHLLIAMHHSPLSMQTAWLDTMVIENADALLERVKRHPNVKALLWGHVHQAYDAELPRDSGEHAHALRLMATPATCFQFLPGSRDFSVEAIAPGYRWITLMANGSIHTEVVRVPGLQEVPDTNSEGY